MVLGPKYETILIPAFGDLYHHIWLLGQPKVTHTCTYCYILICIYTCISVYLSACQSASLPVYLSRFLSISLFLSLHLCTALSLSLSLSLSISLSLSLSISLSEAQSIGTSKGTVCPAGLLWLSWAMPTYKNIYICGYTYISICIKIHAHVHSCT